MAVRHWILLGLVSAKMLSSQTPPTAPRVEHREVRHGAAVTDDYFWLREKSNPKVTQYLEAENAYTAAITKDLQPFSDALYKEMLGRIKQTDLSVPTPNRGYLYYSRTEEGKQYPIQCRRKGNMEAPEEVLLDLKFEEIYNDKDELYDIDISKSRDRQYLFLQSEAKDTSETRYLRADRPAGDFSVFLPRAKGHRYYLDHREGLFYIRTSLRLHEDL